MSKLRVLVKYLIRLAGLEEVIYELSLKGELKLLLRFTVFHILRLALYVPAVVAGVLIVKYLL